MGLKDYIVNTLMSYKADVTDAVKGIEKLEKAERDLQQQTLDLHKKREAALQGHIDGIGKLDQAFHGVANAAKFARDAIASHTEHERSRARAGIDDINMLRQASNGLKSDMQLMSEAAKLQSGAFKLNNEQLAIAEKAMLAYTRKGHESSEVTKKITDAVVGLKTDGLADLGVFVDKSGLSMENAADRGEIFRRVMVALGAASIETADAQAIAAEKAEQTAIRLENAYNKIKNTIGGVVAKAPGYIESEVRDRARAIVGTSPLLRWMGYDPIDEDEFQRRSGAPQGLTDAEWFAATAQRSQNAAILGLSGSGGYIPEAIAGNTVTGATPIDLLQNSMQGLFAQRYTRSANMPADWGGGSPAVRGGVGGRIRGNAQAIDNIWEAGVSQTIGLLIGDAMSAMKEGADRDAEMQAAQLAAAAGDTQFDLDRMNALLDKAGSSLRSTGDTLSADERYAAFTARSSGSKLEQMFGPLEEFNAYKMAFDALAGGVSAAMTAWIDGSMSAGKAFKAFIAEAVKGIAVQMAMEALKHGAYAIGSLAFGDFRGAATHGKAAAAFTLGAVAAAAAAKGLNGGGSAPSTGGAGAAAPIGSGSSAPQYQGRREVIVVGDSWGDTTPRQRAINTRRRVEEAYGAAGVLNE